MADGTWKWLEKGPGTQAGPVVSQLEWVQLRFAPILSVCTHHSEVDPPCILLGYSGCCSYPKLLSVQTQAWESCRAVLRDFCLQSLSVAPVAFQNFLFLFSFFFLFSYPGQPLSSHQLFHSTKATILLLQEQSTYVVSSVCQEESLGGGSQAQQ